MGKKYLKLILLGLLAAFLVSGEVLIVKVASSLKIDGDICGYFYSFFVGILGITCFMFLIIIGYDPFRFFDAEDYTQVFFGGVMEGIGMVL